jgi:ATP-dependent protease ClpP protease subunit
MENPVNYILINFLADVNELSVNNLITFVTQNIYQIEGTQGLGNVEIVIQIASNGGVSDKGILAYNYLKQLNVPITTINIGNVDSAAAMIFLAGSKRLCTPSSRFVLHSAMTQINGIFTYEKLQELANLNKGITKQYTDVIQLVTGRNLHKKILNGLVLNSIDSVKYNISTEVIKEQYIKTTVGVNTLLIQNPQQPILANNTPGQQQIIQM